jgi:hypothetical protein
MFGCYGAAEEVLHDILAINHTSAPGPLGTLGIVAIETKSCADHPTTSVLIQSVRQPTCGNLLCQRHVKRSMPRPI